MTLREGIGSDGAALSAMVIIVLLLTGISLQRNKAYGSFVSLWTDVEKKSPMKSRAHNNLGNSYMLLEKYFTAIEEYKKAIALDENNTEAYYNIGICLDNVGLFNQAAYYYDIFYRKAPAAYSDQRKFARERIDAFQKEAKQSRPRRHSYDPTLPSAAK